MALTVTHPFVSVKPDGGDASLVQPTNWNADHALVGTLPVANGGTAAATASDARTNLGLGTIATQNANNVTISGGSMSGVTITSLDSNTTFQDNADPTKQMQFELSGVSGGQTSVLTIPDADGTLPLLSLAQTFSAAQTYSAGIVLSGAASNVTTGSNYIGNDGTDAGVTFDASNNATFTANLSVNGSTTLGNAAGDVLTIPGTTVTAANGLAFNSTALVLTSAGNLGIGVSPSVAFQLDRASGDARMLLRGDTAARINIRRYGDNINGAESSFEKARGTIASPTVVQNGDQIGVFSFLGYSAAAGTHVSAAQIAGYVDGTPDSAADPSDMPGRLDILTSPDGSATSIVRFRVDSSGNTVNIGTAGLLGYGTGAGGTVTQATSRTTGVTLNKSNGAITLVSAAGTTSWQTFTVTNSLVSATDTVIVCQKSGTDLNEIHVTAVAAGSFNISFRTTGGTTTEQPVFNFAVIKAVTS